MTLWQCFLFMWPDAGAGLPIRYSVASAKNRDEMPVNVLKSEKIGGVPWFQVELLEQMGESAKQKVLLKRWVPGYGSTGEITVWFFSRAC